jgi:hypothetical protein
MTRRATLAAAGALGSLFAASYAVISGTRRDRSTAPLALNALVVAELFTSEGCSSCPPADALLITLVQHPRDGVTVLGLSEHVDCWNRLGWRDPFSAAAFSTRQREYQASAFPGNAICTPNLSLTVTCKKLAVMPGPSSARSPEPLRLRKPRSMFSHRRGRIFAPCRPFGGLVSSARDTEG